MTDESTTRMDKFKEGFAASLPAAIFASLIALGTGLLGLYSDNARIVADIERIQRRAEDTEHRLDICAERVSRLQAYIEFRQQ